MDIYEIRRRNALRLADEIGGPAAFAREIDRSESLVSRMLADPSKKTRKNIGNAMARHIERSFEEPEGSLDSPHQEGVSSEQFQVMLDIYARLSDTTRETAVKLLRALEESDKPRDK